jgi:hypothetical protein
VTRLLNPLVDELAQEEADDGLVQKIDGTAWVTGGPYLKLTIKVGSTTGSCTGMAISPTAILTAAHCALGATSGMVTAKTHSPNYASPGVVKPGTWVTRTRPVDFVDSSPGASGATFVVHENYTGLGDHSDDIAVLKLDGVVVLPAASDYAVVWDESTSKNGSNITNALYGVGREDKTNNAMYGGNLLPTAWSSSSIKGKRGTSGSYVCHSDSGGPLTQSPLSNQVVIAGVLSEMQVNKKTDQCAKSGGTMYWTATDAKTSWLKQQVSSCKSITGSNGYKYVDCY